MDTQLPILSLAAGAAVAATAAVAPKIRARLALSRAMPDIYRAMRVERVAPFFQAFQMELSALNRQDDSRVCVLTPGPLNETYFEHAYLARYLGFLLVEGEDLVVRDDGVFIRTVSGLKRAEVLLRRLDSDFADPLELDVRSRLGVPGLVQAIRDGTVVMLRVFGRSRAPSGCTSLARSTVFSTACASTPASPAPRQRRMPPPNGNHVVDGGFAPRKRSGRNSCGDGHSRAVCCTSRIDGNTVTPAGRS